METKFIRIGEVIDEVPSSFEQSLDKLKQDIQNEQIPSWILIPDRNAGEHATGGAWMAAVWGMCSSGDDVLTARVAWDTSDRARRKSNAGEVPSEIRKVIVEATENIEDDVDMCVLKLKYNTETRNLQDLKIGLNVDVEKEKTSEDN
jgi:hypothetical protein